MTSPEPTPERLDELLAGAEPRNEAERETLALMRQVRTVDDEPSAALRERVQQIGTTVPATRERWFERLPRMSGGFFSGPRLAIAGGVATLALVAVVAIPLMGSGSSDGTTLADAPTEQKIEQESAGLADGDDNAIVIDGASGVDEAASDVAAPESAPAERVRGEIQAVPNDAIAPGPDPGRPQEVRVQTVVQVKDVSELSTASASAMKLVRELGGFTVSSDYSVPGAERGANQLIFKVPAARVEEALEGFAEIGSITSQNASLVDLGDQLSASQIQITKRRERVRSLREELEKNPGGERLTAQLNSAERGLAVFIERRKAIQERARLATINLTLTTAGPVADDGEDNRFVAAFSRSADRLGVALEWLISAAVFLLPLGLLGWLALRFARTARSRTSRRLMDAI